MKKAYVISLRYEVEVNENNLLRGYQPRTFEDIEHAKRLLHAVLAHPEAEDFLITSEIAGHISSLEDEIFEVISGVEEGNYTPITDIFPTLSNEDRAWFTQDYYEESHGGHAYSILLSAFNATLEQVQVRKVPENNEQLDTLQQQNYPRQKQRHHKRKTRKR